jgi:hypothetical protein
MFWLNGRLAVLSFSANVVPACDELIVVIEEHAEITATRAAMKMGFKYMAEMSPAVTDMVKGDDAEIVLSQ